MSRIHHRFFGGTQPSRRDRLHNEPIRKLAEKIELAGVEGESRPPRGSVHPLQSGGFGHNGGSFT